MASTTAPHLITTAALFLVALGAFAGLSTVPALAQAPGASLVTLTDASGAVVGTVRGDGDRLTVHDESGKPIARLKVEADRVRLRDLKDADRWTVKRKDQGAEVEDGRGRRLYRIRRAGSDWKLEDGGKRVLGTLKPTAKAIALVDPSGSLSDVLPLVERAALWAYFARVHR